MSYPQIHVRLRMIIIKNGQVLLTHNKAKNYYYYIGGHLEYGESILDGCVREIKEECGPDTEFTFQKILYIRAGGVWDLTENSDNPKSKKIAIEECHCCPSGWLIALDSQTNKPIEEKVDPSIGVDSFGPLCVAGKVSIESSEGKIYPHRPRRALCRCGKSRNKPFCDGSHFD